VSYIITKSKDKTIYIYSNEHQGDTLAKTSLYPFKNKFTHVVAYSCADYRFDLNKLPSLATKLSGKAIDYASVSKYVWTT